MARRTRRTTKRGKRSGVRQRARARVTRSKRNRVDLTDTGTMLDSLSTLRFTPDQQGVVVGFLNQQRRKIAEYHQTGAGPLPERKIMPIPKRDAKYGELAIVKEAEALFRKRNRENFMRT